MTREMATLPLATSVVTNFVTPGFVASNLRREWNAEVQMVANEKARSVERGAAVVALAATVFERSDVRIPDSGETKDFLDGDEALKVQKQLWSELFVDQVFSAAVTSTASKL
ncbi:MAG: hypothetical protein CYPHOPRED_006019 [Cyphobasidiales sp. Tagirdzhanova-0007]|nr:MAG: hypothetical protein CYPHOPRED_006019 [Cyphobasidiales sp. Tagirdzhanova-0007]